MHTLPVTNPKNKIKKRRLEVNDVRMSLVPRGPVERVQYYVIMFLYHQFISCLTLLLVMVFII